LVDVGFPASTKWARPAKSLTRIVAATPLR
jgi:hypothetical protein